MIDRAKNVCYLITVPYTIGGRADTNYLNQKFLSLHQAHTKHFEAFRDRYFKEVLHIPASHIGEWEDDGYVMGWQRTIGWHEWNENAELRKQVLEGITEREKCW